MQGRILTRIGADGIVFPERESALRWAHNLLLPRLERYIELGEGHGLVYSAAPKAFHHKTLEDIQLRARFGVNLVAVKRSVDVQAPGRPAAAGGAVYTLPGPGTKILPDDVLILVGSDENLGRLPRE
jgi:trk system potassium uptake protein TrkA